MKEVDLTIIGGGINGVSVAAEAASRGLSTLLVHTHDLANSGSAPPVTLAGTHLQHLSALDYFQLNSMLEELQKLKRCAPQLLDLLPVTLPTGDALKEKGQGLIERYFQGMRDKALANVCEPAITSKSQSLAARIKPARLIIAKALQAQKYGAQILPYHALKKAKRNAASWQLDIESTNTSKPSSQTLQTKLLVNCSGWQANELLEDILNVKTRCKAEQEHRTQFFFHNPGVSFAATQVLKLQGQSKQAYYVYPVINDLLAFGPRKCDQQGFAECVELLQAFIDTWNEALTPQSPSLTLTREHFVYQRKSKLALIADPCSNNSTPMTTPLHDLDNPGGAAVLLNIFGVDVALHRKVARQALDILQPFTGAKPVANFEVENLPGGDIGAPHDSKTGTPAPCLATYVEELHREYPQLPSSLLERFTQNYGSLCYVLLGHSETLEDLGEHFGHNLYQREVEYLIEMEWATCADDILWRRTLLGLHFTDQQATNLENWIAAKYPIIK